MNLSEEEFREAPIYRDHRGYIWQCLRSGTWRSTDGVYMLHGVSLDVSGPKPPPEWGPYQYLVDGRWLVLP